MTTGEKNEYGLYHPVLKTKESGEEELKKHCGELVYTETVINAPPAVVREKLVDLDKWPE